MQQNNQNEYVNNGAIKKIDRYNWEIVDAPGRQVLLDKNKLIVDIYQRELTQSSNSKILAIASKWSWVACGTISIGKRSSEYYVIDGQHRVEAAKKRADIKLLPCLVFDTVDIKQEAKGFLMSNTSRKPMTFIQKMNALCCSGDPSALFVKNLIESSGRRIGQKTSPTTVSCVGLLVNACDSKKDDLIAIWPMLVDICRDNVFHSRIVSAFLLIQSLYGGDFSKSKWAKRAKEVGYNRLIEGCNKASAFYANGGDKIWARGIVEAINYKLKNKLIIPKLMD